MNLTKKSIRFLGLIVLLAQLAFGCGTSKSISIDHYYDYDANYPLRPEVQLVRATDVDSLFHVTYKSVHQQRVPALLNLPRSGKRPLPVILFLHGLGDNKSVDYMDFGTRAFVQAGYAVFRIDYALHGERRDPDFKFNLRKPYPFTTRNAIVQTVFDLRRAVDYLQSRSDINPARIGFMGISLGGITGAVFCGVEPRVKVSVLALAGGGLKVLFGYRMFSARVGNLLAPIEPLNFVAKIAPRPVLFINASRDEVIPPMLAKRLQKAAGKPKHVVWYPTKHRKIPLKESFQEAVDWFKKYL
ncbi:MAG: hypothetical protein GXO76_10960 [Calditrichaeota bacterium]|nr:hypothetical protein [Calditrichota bacterium]